MQPLVTTRTLTILKTLSALGTADAEQVSGAFPDTSKVTMSQFESLEKRGLVVRVGRAPGHHTLIRRRLTMLGRLLLAYGHEEHKARKKARNE